MKDLNAVHLNGLRAVEATGRLGSLKAAADELGVTIGAVSQQIIKTEQQLGRVLFERSPRGLVLTPAGESLMPRLNGGFEMLDQAVASARRRDESILTISVAPVFAARWLVSRLDRFALAHPDISLRIDATTRLANLDTSDVDIGIRVGLGQWPGVRAEPLLAQEVFPVCAPAIAETLREPADILQCPAVIDGRSMFSWETWLREVGLSGAQMKVRHVFNEASPVHRRGDCRPRGHARLADAGWRFADRRTPEGAVSPLGQNRLRPLFRDVGRPGAKARSSLPSRPGVRDEIAQTMRLLQ